jgi:Ca2+-transporting ATPase
MATLHDDARAGHRLVYLKGAVEVVLDRCHAALGAKRQPVPLDRAQVQAQVAALAAQGLRVLAFARAEVPAETARLDVHSLPRDFAFLGLQGMIDPPRAEAARAVAACQQAGIRIKMITGDHAKTAAAIARQLNIAGVVNADGTENVVTGQQRTEGGAVPRRRIASHASGPAASGARARAAR